MCYEALVDGDATADSVGSVVRAERRDAAVNGLEAAVLLVVVLLWQGVALSVVLAAALAAVALGYVLHQVVLLVGVALLRLRASRGGADRSGAA